MTEPQSEEASASLKPFAPFMWKYVHRADPVGPLEIIVEREGNRTFVTATLLRRCELSQDLGEAGSKAGAETRVIAALKEVLAKLDISNG